MPTNRQHPYATEHPSDQPRAWAGRLASWAWLPIPTLFLAIIVTRITDVHVAPTPAQVLFSIDVLTRLLPTLVVIVMAAMSFLLRGTPGMLLLGCGVAMWTATGYVNTFFLALDPNFGITVTNVGLGLAALCHLAGVLTAGARKMSARGLGLATGYGLVLVAIGLVCWAAWQSWLPRFFIEGAGGTPVRCFVLSAAMIMFVLSALLLSAKQQTASSRFAFWYTLALWLIALSIFGMLIQDSRESLQNWMNRITQYLGSIYLLIAAITALRESGGAWLLPMEDALRESEERYHRLFDSMTEGFLLAELIRDADGTPIDFRILEANLAYEPIFGCSREAAIGKTLFEVFPGLDIDRFAAIAQVAQTGEPLRWQGLFAPTGRFYENVYYSPRPGQLAGIFSDITARKQAEEALQRKDMELSEAQRIAHIGSWYWDAKTDVTTGSDELLRIYGFDPATQAMPNFTDQRGSCYPVEDWERINAAVQQTVETGVGYELDVQVIRNDTRIWVTTRGEGLWDGEGRIVGLRGTVQDITARKQAEEALRESEERFRTIAESLPGLVWQYDAATGVNVFVNRSFCEFAGRAPAGLLGRAYEDVLHPGDVEALTPRFAAAVAAGQTFEAEYRFRRHDGQWRWQLVRTVPQKDTTGTVVQWFGMAVDITDRKQAEEALWDSEARIQQILESIQDDFYTLDRDWVFTFASKSFTARIGKAPEDFVGHCIWTMFPHHLGTELEDNFRAAMERREVRRFELHGRYTDVWYRMTVFPSADGITVLGTDITARKQTEEALRENEYKYRSIFENSMDAVFLAIPNQRVIAANPAACAMFGKTEAELCQVGRAGIEDPTDPRHAIAVAERDRTGSVKYEATHVRKDGTSFPTEVSSVIMDGGTRSLVIIRDITERKQAEEALRESDFRLQVALQAGELGWHDYTVATGEILWDRNCRAMWGIGPDDPVDINVFWAGIHPDSVAETTEKLEASIDPACDGRFDSDYLVRPLDGSPYRWVHATGQTIFAGEGAERHPVHVIGTVQDITARKQTEETLRTSEERYRMLFQGFPISSVVFQADGDDFVIVDYNRESLAFTGGHMPEFVGKTAGELYQATPEILDAFARISEQHPTAQLEIPYHKLSTDDDLFLRMTLAYVSPGKVMLHSEDITERVMAEKTILASLQEKDVLLKEIHHRVKNNMQVISSLVSLQSDTLDDPVLRAVFNDLRDQVRTMALVHEKLYQAESLANIDFAEYTQSLLSYLWRAHGDAVSDIRLTLDVQPMSISIEQAVPCGLILNELVTNALKHAFRDRTDGELTVALHADPDGTVYLSVRDNGVGLPADWRQSPSLGLQLVQILAGQIHGALEVRTDGGTSFTLTFALPKSRQHGEDQHA